MKKFKTIHDKCYQNFISELAKERVRLNVSQAELAANIGLNQSDISKIEKFEKRLDILELKRILEALRIANNMQLQKMVADFIGIQI